MISHRHLHAVKVQCVSYRTNILHKMISHRHLHAVKVQCVSYRTNILHKMISHRKNTNGISTNWKKGDNHMKLEVRQSLNLSPGHSCTV